MPTYQNNVIEIEKQTNQFGEYAIITVEKENGEIAEKKVFGQAAKEFTVPGLYDCETEKRMGKKGPYTTITKATLLSETANGVEPVKPIKTQPRAFTRDLDTNRSILVQVCIKSAAEVYNGTNLVEAGQGLPVMLAEKFLEWADKQLNPKLEDVPFGD